MTNEEVVTQTGTEPVTETGTEPVTETGTEPVTEEVKEEKTLSPNERAEANITAMKAENDRMEKNILAQQEMRATDMLGGKAQAGQTPVEKKEMSDEEYAKKVMSGEL